MNEKPIAWADYGPEDANPVFVLHGTPGSRFEHPINLSICNETNSRLIVPDRPGYGMSKFDAKRSLTSLSGQIITIADKLGISTFSVLGFSGGGAYAMALGVQFPERINRIALIGSVAPFDVSGLCEAMPPGNLALFNLAATDYLAASAQLSSFIDGADSLLEFFDATVSEPDKSLFTDLEFRQMYRQNLAEAVRNGLDGMAYDMGIIARPWEIDPAEIKAEVQLWHGKKDFNIPLQMSQHLNAVIPNSALQLLPDAGHWILFPYYREVLIQLSNSTSE